MYHDECLVNIAITDTHTCSECAAVADARRYSWETVQDYLLCVLTAQGR